MDGTAEVVVRQLAHVFDFGLQLPDSQGRRDQHRVVKEMQMKLVVAKLIDIVGNEAAHQANQVVGQRQCDQGGADVENGMEHGQLHLRGMREHSFKHPPISPIPLGKKMKNQGDKQKQSNTHYIEKQMDKRSSFGVSATGHAGQNRHYARADVGTHRKVDTLVEREQSRHDHGNGDGRQHRRRLDDGRQQCADENN